MALVPHPPRDRLPERPASRSLAVEPELGGQAVEAAEDGSPRVPELAAADERRDPELALPRERLRVDREPRLTLRGEDVPGVQVLVQEDRLALRGRERPERVERRVEEPPLERPAHLLPLLAEGARPPRRLLGKRAERRARRLPEPRQEPDHDVERRVRLERGERRPRPRPLEEQRVPLRIVREQPDRPVAVPELERLRLVLALAVRELDLQDHVPGGQDERREGVLEGRSDLDSPLLATVRYESREAAEPGPPGLRLLEPG